jgi:hypothetical protein
MDPVSIPFASQSFFETNWVFLFAIPPLLVGLFFGAYQPRTRRSLWRLGLAEAATALFVGACILLRAFEIVPTDGIWGPFALLGTLGWPAGFIGAAGRIVYDARRPAAVS